MRYLQRLYAFVATYSMILSYCLIFNGYMRIHCYILNHYSYSLNNMQTLLLNTIILVNNSMFIRNVFNCFITVCIIIVI